MIKLTFLSYFGSNNMPMFSCVQMWNYLSIDVYREICWRECVGSSIAVRQVYHDPRTIPKFELGSVQRRKQPTTTLERSRKNRDLGLSTGCIPSDSSFIQTAVGLRTCSSWCKNTEVCRRCVQSLKAFFLILKPVGMPTITNISFICTHQNRLVPHWTLGEWIMYIFRF